MSTASELLQVLSEMSEDERRTLLVLARRLLDGQRVYGRLDLTKDRRNFRAERSLEIQDLLIYSAFAELASMTIPNNNGERR